MRRPRVYRPLVYLLSALLVLVAIFCVWFAWEHRRQDLITLRFCTDEEWETVSRDFNFWEEDIGDQDSPEYERWVDDCERLDAQLAAALGDNTYNHGAISNFRCRGIYVPVGEFSGATIEAVHALLAGEFASWEVFVHVGGTDDDDPSLGSVLIQRNKAFATQGVEAALRDGGHHDSSKVTVAP